MTNIQVVATGVLTRGDTQTQRRSPVKTEAETGGRRPQAQGRLEPPEAGRGRKDLPPAVSGRSAACPHPDLRFVASRTVRA